MQVTELRLTLAAGGALAAGGHEREDAAVAGPEVADARSDFLDDAGALVAKHGGEREGRGALHDVMVGGTDAGGAHFNPDFPVLRLVLDEVFDSERGVGCVEDGSAHGWGLPQLGAGQCVLMVAGRGPHARGSAIPSPPLCGGDVTE